MTEATLDAWRSADIAAIYPAVSDDFWDSGRPLAAKLGTAASVCTGHPVGDLSVADVGAGVGRVARHLTGWGQVGIIEPNEDYVRVAAIAAPRSSFYPSLEAALDEAGPAAFDVVFSFRMLQHYRTATRIDLLYLMTQLSRRLIVFQLPVYDRPREPVGWTDVGVWTPTQMDEVAALLDVTIRQVAMVRGVYDPSWTLEQIPEDHFGLHVFDKRKDDHGWNGENGSAA